MGENGILHFHGRYLNEKWSEEMDLMGKTAIITGAAGGIGAQTARQFVAVGAKVMLVDLDENKLDQLSREIGQENAVYSKTDLTKLSEIEGMVKYAVKELGKIDILVNAAGVCQFVGMHEITEENWDEIININLKSVFFLSRSVMEKMKGQKSGKIINIASSAAENGGILAGAHYCAAKAGVINLTKSLARLLAEDNIQVNVISPGPVDTQMVDVLSDAKKTEYISQIPLKRMGTPEDIASAILFLANSSSNYITGQIIRVNGGLIM